MILSQSPVKVIFKKEIEEKRPNELTDGKSIIVPTSVFGGKKVVVTRVGDEIKIAPINYSNASIVKNLESLKKLHENGVIDKSVYEQHRDILLAKLVAISE